jgi:hypothetical protein
MHAPFAQPAASPTSRVAASELNLPSIQEFLDELPSIDDFVAAGEWQPDELLSIDEYLEDYSGDVAEFDESAPATDYDEAGWAVADWQSFDWSGAAMLGSRGSSEPTAGSRSRPGSDVDMTDHAQRSREITPSADEVARALDGIAQRIRSGELAIEKLTGAPPEAAMAAALAALLRMRG